MKTGGRPKLGREVKERFQVMIEPRIAERLRKLGGGNLSRGIATAADYARHWERHCGPDDDLKRTGRP